ncbi:MAG: hypothetical protein ACREX8_03370, partial [Gammaproteobacteria bacterium]
AFGFFISVPGDVDADGKPDIAIGTDAQDVFTGSGTGCGQPEPNGCNEDQGKAWVFSGDTAAVLYALDNPFPQGNGAANRARFGSRIGRAGDLNGDGVSDIIVGASGNDVPAGCGDVNPLPQNCRRDQGQAFIFSGKPSDHAGGASGMIRTLDLPADDFPQNGGTPCPEACGTFGLSVQSPGDLGTPGAPGSSVAGPRDGVPDQLVDSGSYLNSQGRMYVFDGASGALIRKVDDPEPQTGAIFGFQDVTPLSPGDVGSVNPNGKPIGARDGYAEIYGNGFIQNAPTDGEGKAWVFDGKTGAVLYSINDPTPERGGQFGWSMSGTKYNDDVFPDLYIGQSPHHVGGATGSGGTYVIDGHNEGLLKGLELPATCVQPSTPGNLGPNLGWTNSAPGDLNGDGEPDYVGGAPFTDVGGNQDQGRLFVYLSNDTSVASCT